MPFNGVVPRRSAYRFGFIRVQDEAQAEIEDERRPNIVKMPGSRKKDAV